MAGIHLRTAVPSDAAAIASLVSQLGYPTTGIEMSGRLTRLLADPDQAMAVAEASGEVIGMVSAQVGPALEFDGIYGRITAMVVDAQWRGRGIGRMLMQHMEGWCRDRHARSVILTSSHHRVEAHKFYTAVGYSATGLRFVKLL